MKHDFKVKNFSKHDFFRLMSRVIKNFVWKNWPRNGLFINDAISMRACRAYLRCYVHRERLSVHLIAQFVCVWTSAGSHRVLFLRSQENIITHHFCFVHFVIAHFWPTKYRFKHSACVCLNWHSTAQRSELMKRLRRISWHQWSSCARNLLNDFTYNI